MCLCDAAEDDAADQGPAAAADAHPEEQAGEGAGELHRPRRPHCRPVRCSSGLRTCRPRAVHTTCRLTSVRTPRKVDARSARGQLPRIEVAQPILGHQNDILMSAYAACDSSSAPWSLSRDGLIDTLVLDPQRCGVRAGARVDAHLLRAAGDAEGAQEGHPSRHRQHLRLHRQGALLRRMMPLKSISVRDPHSAAVYA